MSGEVKFKSGYFIAPNDIFETELNAYEKIVYLYLVRCGNNSIAFPSYNTIAEKCGMSKRKTIDVVSSLQEKKLLIKGYRNKNGENKSNTYEVLNPKIEKKRGGGAQHALGVVHDMHPIKNYNYKELNNKGRGINSGRSSSFSEFIKYASIEDMRAIEVVEHYLNAYHFYIEKEHPKLKDHQWRHVVDDLFCFYDESTDREIEPNEEELKDMINKHFATFYQKGCDYNIMHFMNKKIRAMRYYEVAH